MKKDKIVIYTNENCPYCKQIKEKLEENKIKYTDKSTVDHKEEWNNITNLTVTPTVPTVFYKDNYFVPARDFPNPQVLLNILKNYKQSSFSETKQLLEKFKTLNFNMSQAFGRLDQRLTQLETKLNKEEDEHKSTS